MNETKADALLPAATEHLEKRLGDAVYWECSSDLIRELQLYLHLLLAGAEAAALVRNQ